jgi:hypothetical protein
VNRHPATSPPRLQGWQDGHLYRRKYVPQLLMALHGSASAAAAHLDPLVEAVLRRAAAQPALAAHLVADCGLLPWLQQQLLTPGGSCPAAAQQLAVDCLGALLGARAGLRGRGDAPAAAFAGYAHAVVAAVRAAAAAAPGAALQAAPGLLHALAQAAPWRWRRRLCWQALRPSLLAALVGARELQGAAAQQLLLGFLLACQPQQLAAASPGELEREGAALGRLVAWAVARVGLALQAGGSSAAPRGLGLPDDGSSGGAAAAGDGSSGLLGGDDGAGSSVVQLLTWLQHLALAPPPAVLPACCSLLGAGEAQPGRSCCPLGLPSPGGGGGSGDGGGSSWRAERRWLALALIALQRSVGASGRLAAAAQALAPLAVSLAAVLAPVVAWAGGGSDARGDVQTAREQLRLLLPSLPGVPARAVGALLAGEGGAPEGALQLQQQPWGSAGATEGEVAALQMALHWLEALAAG